MNEATFSIAGMRCGGCMRRVSDLLQALPGVQVESVSVGLARVRLEPGGATRNRVIEALGDAGYAAREE